MSANRDTVRLSAMAMLDKITGRPLIYAWLDKGEKQILEATKQLVVRDNDVIDKLVALLPADFKETAMADKTKVGYRDALIAEIKTAAEAQAIDWAKVQDFISKLGLPILLMILDYLKKVPMTASIKSDGSCDHQCCCCEYIDMADLCLAEAKAHCDCCVSK